MKENNNAFDVRNLNFWYGDKKVLKKVSLEIMKNNIVSLIGPSGCGKSTFLRCLNKMNDLTPGVKIEGSIIFDNQYELIQVNKNNFLKFKNKSNSITPLELRTRVGMVFQKPNPFVMSIYDNVAFGPRSCGIRKKKELDRIVKQALKDAALWQEVKNSLHDPALSLSGGQQQRLCIARTIAMHPEVILMDEPTSALDPIATGKIEELIIKLKKKYSIVIVTHSMQQAKRLSDQVAFFYLGAIKECGSVNEVFQNPQHKFTQNYLSGNFG